MPDKYRAPSVTKAFQILALISDADRGLGISELAKRLGICKGTVHGITLALEEMGAILRDPHTKKYSLGYTIVELGNKGLTRAPLREVARKHMEALVEETDQTVFLGVLTNDHVFILDSVESALELKITSPSGAKLPLSAGATGKLFLAHMDREAALEYLNSKGLVEYTGNSITELELFIREMDEVKQRGFALDREEYLRGVRAVAALVRTEGQPLIAIWTVGFSSSITNDKMQYLIDRTRVAADAISLDLRSGS